MLVYAKKEGTYIWSDNNGSHKAGKVPLHEPLFTHGEKPSGWYAINRPDNLSLPVQPGYPDYWVKVGDTVLHPGDDPDPTPDPTPDSGSVSDADAADAIVRLIRYFKQ